MITTNSVSSPFFQILRWIAVGFRGVDYISLTCEMEVPNHAGVEIAHISTFAGLNGGNNHSMNGLGPSTVAGDLKLYEGFNGKE